MVGLWDRDRLAALLDDLGQQRFLEKARRFGLSLDTSDPDHVLYEGIMRALGYSKNQEAFLELARRMPLARLTQATQGLAQQDALPVLEALLLGDRIAVMRAGRLVQVGTPHDLLLDPADDYVADLMATPARQADALAALRRA